MSGNLITKILATEIKDSRNNPTVKVTVSTSDFENSFSVPSGASTGSHEALEMRDDDGKGVLRALNTVNNIIAPALVGKDVTDQREIDNILLSLDGTKNKSNLGGNSMIGVSIACAKTAALCLGLEVYDYLRTLAEIKPSRNVPFLYMNLINGGKHAANGIAFQEYHIVPEVDDVEEAFEMGLKIDHVLREILLKDFGEEAVVMGDEGGFAPKMTSIRDPLVYLNKAIDESGLSGKVRLALDVAASSFYEDGFYKVDGKDLLKLELMEIYENLIQEFNLLSIEDPFYEEDFESFKNLQNKKKVLVVGDDLTVTNKLRLEEACNHDSVNALIIKPNQVGTLSETLDAMQHAREKGVELIVSHRSGEVEDEDFIADLAYAFNCFGLKTGAPTKQERVVKYKRLIEILEIQKKL